MARGWRLLIVCLSRVAFLGWTMLFAGSQIADQAATLQTVVMAQIERIAAWASDHGMGNFQLDAQTIADNTAGTVGRVTAAVGTVLGGQLGRASGGEKVWNYVVNSAVAV